MHDYEVNSLQLPPLLVELLRTNRWCHPGDDVLRSFIPYLHEPVDFLSLDQMRRESTWFLADDPKLSQLFYEVRSSKQNTPIDLPWLDVEYAILIAVNRFPGDDIGIALDYRTDPRNPRVVASDWWSSPGNSIWQEVVPTFSQFVERLKLD